MISHVPGRGADRPVSIGHKGHKVTNNFGYDEFLRLCKRLGAEPIIVVGLCQAHQGKKPLAEAALEAAGLVAYCNARRGTKLPEGMLDWPSVRALNGHREPYGVKYWQIGNETWSYFKKLKKVPSGGAAQHYADCVMAFARAMLAVDPDIVFIVDGYGPTYEATRLVRDQLGDKLRHFVFHDYLPWAIGKTVEKNGKPVAVDELSVSDIWYTWVATPYIDDDGLSYFSEPIMDEARREGFKVAVTEWNWNGWWTRPKGALNSSLAKGIGAAGFLHALMRSADVIEIGCQSMLVGKSWSISAILADPEAKAPPYYMPCGQATMLYSRHHGPKLLALEATGVPTYVQPIKMEGIRARDKVAYLDALVTASDQTVFFHVINRHFDEAIEVNIDVTDVGRFTGKARHYVLTGRLHNEPGPGQSRQVADITHSDTTYDGRVLKVALPARTVSCIEMYRR
jgi:alpha-N-arabinofuranosidase